MNDKYKEIEEFGRKTFGKTWKSKFARIIGITPTTFRANLSKQNMPVERIRHIDLFMQVHNIKMINESFRQVDVLIDESARESKQIVMINNIINGILDV